MSGKQAKQTHIPTVERQRRALELRKAGWQFIDIANELGYKDASGSYHAVASALKKTLQEPADELRQLEATRLDQLLLGLWPKAIKGDTWAVDRVLKIMERRAALLGLDAPVKREDTLHVMIQTFAKKAAAAAGLDPALAVAEAERIVAAAVAD